MIIGKKGQEVESQVHWIFILIAGALIITLFTAIVLKQKDSSRISLEGKIGAQLNAVLIAAQQASGSVQSVPLSDVTLHFSCDDFSIGDTSRRLGRRIVYAPSTITGTDLLIWSLDVNMPYRTGNVLYVTSSQMRYYLLSTSSTPSEFWQVLNGSSTNPRAEAGLPREIKRNKDVLTSSSTFPDKNDKHVRFIIVDGNTEDTSSLPVASQLASRFISAVVINPTEHEVGVFIRGPGSQWTKKGPTITYPDITILYGLIYTVDVDSAAQDKSLDRFECITKKVIEKSAIVSKLYYYKFNTELAVELNQSDCVDYYKDSPEMKTLAGIGTPAEWTNADSKSLSTSFASALAGLQRKNDELQLRSCPLLY